MAEIVKESEDPAPYGIARVTIDISDEGLAKSKQESLDKIRQWCDEALWTWRIDKMIAFSKEFGDLLYTTEKYSI